MHECTPYGYLAVNDRAIDIAQLARLVGEAQRTVKQLLAELENAGVFSRTETGWIYSRRMVNDERLREVPAESGRLGGHPDVLKQKSSKTVADDPANIEQTLKQKPPPSSSARVARPRAQLAYPPIGSCQRHGVLGRNKSNRTGHPPRCSAWPSNFTITGSPKEGRMPARSIGKRPGATGAPRARPQRGNTWEDP